MSAVDGNTYPNYPLAPDFQGCRYSDPDHGWEGWLVQHNHGRLDGFLQRPTTPANNPGVKLAAATLPTIWDQLSPIPNSNGIPTGGYYYRDSPFLALWAPGSNRVTTRTPRGAAHGRWLPPPRRSAAPA